MAEALRTEDRLGHEVCNRDPTQGQGSTQEASCTNHGSVCASMFGSGQVCKRGGLRTRSDV